MNELLTYSITVFTGFFAMVNPISMTTVFLSLTADNNKESKKRIARKACITAFVIVVAFVIMGKYIFELFDITIPAFKITGGFLIFYVGFQMLMSNSSKVHSTGEEVPDEGIAISPLAIPIIAGPGTIVTAMNNITDGSFLHIGIVIIIFAIMLLLTYWAFTMSDIIVKKLGNNIIKVIGKLMGLILAIMGTGMIIVGIKLSFNIG